MNNSVKVVYCKTMRRITLITFVALIVFLGSFSTLLAGTGSEKDENPDFGLSKSARLGNVPGGPTVSIPTVLGSIAGSALTFVGVLFLLLMIYAGFLWMTGSRGGKDDDINKAKKIMTWAIAGLAVIFLSYTIVSFVVGIAEKAPNLPTDIAPDTGTGVPLNAG